MLNGVAVDKLFAGGPAFCSQKVSHGDVVLKVDGEDVSRDNVIDAIIGNDEPGSIVNITLKKPGFTVSVWMRFSNAHEEGIKEGN